MGLALLSKYLKGVRAKTYLNSTPPLVISWVLWEIWLVFRFRGLYNFQSKNKKNPKNLLTTQKVQFPKQMVQNVQCYLVLFLSLLRLYCVVFFVFILVFRRVIHCSSIQNVMVLRNLVSTSTLIHWLVNKLKPIKQNNKRNSKIR